MTNPTIDHRPSTFDLPTFDLRPSDLRPSTFDLRPSTFDLRPSTFDLRLCSLKSHKIPPISKHEPRDPTSPISLKACAQELRCRCETITSIQGGHTYYHEELETFRAYAHEHQLFLEATPPELNRPPDDEGNEHQVWFDEKSSSYFKATWPNFFGMSVFSDTHRGNIILMQDGLLAPIDLRVQALTPSLLDIVKNLCDIP